MNGNQVFPTLTRPCPYCQKLLDIRFPVTEDGLIRCPICDNVSELDKGIVGFGLFKYPKYLV
jgi:hypothetical protein